MTPELLQRAMACSMERAERFAPGVTQVCTIYDINTPLRQAHFIAQVGHETGSFKWLSEIWGPTAQQRRYERDPKQPWTKTDPRNRLAFELGNTEPGDGSRYRGRGAIMVTGRTNYAAFRRRMVEHLVLGANLQCAYVPDFVEEPELLATDAWAMFSAGDYWNEHGLNQWADADKVTTVTRKINGGTNGLEDRKKRLVIAKAALLH